jgi:hypothetical protein
MPYASDNNAVLIDGCNDLQNLSVLLEVTEDIATTAGTGWSLQLNCYAPPGQYCQASQVNVFQYIVVVQSGSLTWYIQYWAYGTSGWPAGYTPVPGTAPWLPCWAHDWGSGSNTVGTFASIDGDTLPRGSKLQIALETNDVGVAKVNFTYTDPDDNTHPYTWTAPEGAVHPIVACELDFVGPPGGAATFTQGITNSRGIIYYSVSSGQLAVQNGGPGAACGEVSARTGETQILQQPVACVVNFINDLVGGDQAQLGEMRQIGDGEVGRYPAGQRLIEVLDRHSADLAVLAASGEGDLARTAWDLLAKAAHITRQGGVFDDTTIDEARKVLERVSCKLPPSMNGIGPAGATVLESLRGRTLEDGLNAASNTILPRFQAAGPRG